MPSGPPLPQICVGLEVEARAILAISRTVFSVPVVIPATSCLDFQCSFLYELLFLSFSYLLSIETSPFTSLLFAETSVLFRPATKKVSFFSSGPPLGSRPHPVYETSCRPALFLTRTGHKLAFRILSPPPICREIPSFHPSFVFE